MVVAERVSEQAYLQLVREAPDRKLELHDGRLVEKPPMSFEHNRLEFRLASMLQEQLGWEDFVVGVDAGRVRRSPRRYFIPDVFVVPASEAKLLRGENVGLEIYADPVLLVVEVWSPSTGDYDVDVKLAEYRRRGDREIWRLHPYQRTLTTWVRQENGGYAETTYAGGIVRPAWLPNVAIDLAALFAVID